MLKVQEIADKLRSSGFKVTPQRLAVYNALARTKYHPNAETLFNELRPFYPTMSLATVYKSLSILCEIGMAQELSLGEDAFRYDADVTRHPHVRCVSCGRVDDVPVLKTHDIDEQAMRETGYELTGRQIYFFGICPECRKKKRGLH